MLISIAYDAEIPHAPLMNHVAMQVNAVLMLMIAAVVLGFSHETRGTLRFVLLVLTAICCVFGFWYLYSM